MVATDSGKSAQGGLDEERLLVERARRNPEAFGEIYVLYCERIFGYVYSRTGSHEASEDITADTFVLAFEHLPRYEWRNIPFRAWLFRIAANQVAAYYRRQRPCAYLDDTIVHMGAGPEEQALRIDDVEEVRQALASLKWDQQRAMRLRYHHDMRAREIAAEMGRTEAAVKLLLHRGMLSLRARMLPLSA